MFANAGVMKTFSYVYMYSKLTSFSASCIDLFTCISIHLKNKKIKRFAHDHEQGESVKRAVLRSATNEAIAAAEEALAAAAADEPLSKYAIAGGVFNSNHRPGGNAGRPGLGNGLVSNVDPAEFVPHSVAASAVRLDSCSEMFKKRVEAAEQAAAEIEAKQQAIVAAEKAVKIVRRNSATIPNDPVSPLPISSNNSVSEATNLAAAGGVGIGKSTLSKVFQMLNSPDQHTVEDNVSVNSKGNNSSIPSMSIVGGTNTGGGGGGGGTKRLQFATQKIISSNMSSNNNVNNADRFHSIFAQVVNGNMSDNVNNKTVKTGSRFDLTHFVDSYGA
jgi:hypothetical protein